MQWPFGTSRIVIFGSRKGSTGCGLVSRLGDLNSAFNDQRITEATLKEKVYLALDAWRRAKPDWRFRLDDVGSISKLPTYSEQGMAVEALYNRNL